MRGLEDAATEPVRNPAQRGRGERKTSRAPGMGGRETPRNRKETAPRPVEPAVCQELRPEAEQVSREERPEGAASSDCSRPKAMSPGEQRPGPRGAAAPERSARTPF